METFLNFIWLMVALGLVAVWRYRWLPSRRAASSRALPEFVALICALALLFPAISLTDDLHPVILAVDAASGKRNGSSLLARASHASNPAPKIAAHAGAVIAANAPLTPIGASRLVSPNENVRSVRISPNLHGRSPPPSLA